MVTNLNDYISSWLFLKNLENSDQNIDKVIFDIDSLKCNDLKIDVEFLSADLEFGINWALKKIVWKKKKIILVLNRFNLYYILPFVRLFKEKIDLNIIWLNSGSIGIFGKFFPEYNDVSLAIDFWIDVYEPLDVINFFDVLKKDWTKYIRITSKDYPNNIFTNIEGNYSDIFSFEDFGVSWEKFTILVGWYLLPEVLQAIEKLNYDNIFGDLFVINKYNFSFTDDLINSLRKTERLLLVSDIDRDLYISYINSLLYYSNLSDVIFDFVWPLVKKITVLNKDYLLEEVKLDWLNLYKRIKKLL